MCRRDCFAIDSSSLGHTAGSLLNSVGHYTAADTISRKVSSPDSIAAADHRMGSITRSEVASNRNPSCNLRSTSLSRRKKDILEDTNPDVYEICRHCLPC